MEIAWVRTIIVIVLFSLSSVVSLCDKVHAEGVFGKFVEAFEKATSSNSPKGSKSKKDKKVKSVSKDSLKKDVASPPGNALAVGGLGGYDVLKFGMGVDEINKKTACNLEAVPESEGLIPGIDVLVCRNFSFDNQPAEAYFAFVDGALQGLTICIPFDKNKLKSLPEKYATKYGVPTSVSPKSDFEAWEKGDPDAKICFVYPNGAIRWSFLIGESGKYHKIIIIYSSEKLIELVDAEDAREAKEDAAIKLGAEFDVNPITGECPLAVRFEDKSVGMVREGCWDFGNGEKSTEQNPTHIYNTPGTYTVKLTVSNKVATDEAIKIVQVLPEKLVADFASVPSRGVAPLEVRFTDSSRGDPGKWEWNFGDGSKSYERSPVHVFGRPGTYTVKLAVSKETINAIEERQIVVFPGDTDFTVNDYTYGFSSGEQIQFMDVSTGRPIMWNWDFGDGQRSDDRNPSHAYTKEGRHTITLTATYAGGRISTKIRPDYVVVVSEEFWPNAANLLLGVLRNTESVRLFLSAIFPKGILDEPMLDRIIHKQISYLNMTTAASSNLYKDAGLLYNINNRSDQYISLLDNKRLCLGILGAAQLTYDKAKSHNPKVPKSYIYNLFTGSDDGACMLESLENMLLVAFKTNPECKDTVISYDGVCCDREHQAVYYMYGLTRAAAENKLAWFGEIPSPRAIYNFALEYAEGELDKCKRLLGKASGGGEYDSYKNECACIEGAIRLLKKTGYKDMFRILMEANGGSLSYIKTEEGKIMFIRH